jgi:uncharacterized membrane protein
MGLTTPLPLYFGQHHAAIVPTIGSTPGTLRRSKLITLLFLLMFLAGFAAGALFMALSLFLFVSHIAQNLLKQVGIKLPKVRP